jgi:DNA ligase 1
MNRPWTVIQKLEADNSRLAKEAILEREMLAGNDELFDGLRLCYDAMITFGVKQVPERTGDDGSGYSWPAFNSNVQKLVKREVTGHDARYLIQDMMDHSTNSQWNDWYRRILIKDMRAGFSEKTVNTVAKKTKMKKYSVPVFECQLAHDSANHESKVAGKKMIEVKLDGVRVITIVHPNGQVDQFSRNGKELVNFDAIKQQFAEIAGELQNSYVFDGEVMSSSFQDLMKQVHRKSDVRADDAVLHLFDIMPLSDFKKGFSNLPQSERSRMLVEWFNAVGDRMPNVAILDHELVDLDTGEGQKRFKEINQRAISGGYEGIMIKEPAAPYECKRTVNWLKLKPFIEVSLRVISTEEGTGRNVGKMGALVCEGEDDGKLIRVNVGSGFTDQQREDFWNCRADGQVVEVRADAVTQNQDGSYSLRFPRFLRFRGFELGEKI